MNALKHLRPGGAIVIDDVVPSSWEKALPDREESIRLETLNNGKADGAWFGDVWKLTVAISELFGDSLDVRTYGFGACGQSVVRYRLKYGVVPDIREAAFGKFKTLAYSDYFSSDGKVLLPGYQSEKTID